MKAEALVRQAETEGKRRDLEGRRKPLEAQIASLRGEIDSADRDLKVMIARKKDQETAEMQERSAMASIRKAD
jgi:hypothetical protein